jgi:hypothetical protein
VSDAALLGCEGKNAFATRSGAFVVMKAMTKRRNFDRRAGLVLCPYRCKHCGHWHIGHEART